MKKASLVIAKTLQHSHSHKDDAERILCEMHENGYRITAPRRAIVDALQRALKPKSASDIASHAKIKDASTVYRTLAELVKGGMVNEIQARGTTYYEIFNTHHDHAVCDSCGKIEHVECNGTVIPSSLRKSGFEVTAHEALWRGLCAQCS